MTWIALPLLLAAATPLPKPVVATTHSVATVQIIDGEEIRFEDMRTNDGKGTARSTLRQKRMRDGMPMVEFY